MTADQLGFGVVAEHAVVALGLDRLIVEFPPTAPVPPAPPPPDPTAGCPLAPCQPPMPSDLATGDPADVRAVGLLLTMLPAAVLLRIEELRGSTAADRAAVAERAADEIAGNGGLLGDGKRQPGVVAGLFNQLARGVAAAAFTPGGITWLGLHFHAEDRS